MICQCGKQCLSRKAGYELVSWLKEKNHWRHLKKIPKRVYYCPECGAYHVTSAPTFIKEIQE